MSSSRSPRRGASAASVTRPHLALGELPVVLEERVVEARRQRQHPRPRAGRHLDRQHVQRRAGRARRSSPPARCGIAAPRARRAPRAPSAATRRSRRPRAAARSRAGAAPSEVSARMPRAGMQQRPDRLDGARPCSDSVSAVLQRPAQPRRREAEGRGRRHHGHFRRDRRPRQRRADAVLERIARGEHADRAPAQRQHPAIAASNGLTARAAPRRGSAAPPARGAAARRTPPRPRDRAPRAGSPSPSTPSSPMPTTASHLAFVARQRIAAARSRMPGLHVLILGGTGEARALAERARRPPGPARHPVARRPHRATRCCPPAPSASAASAAPTGLAALPRRRRRRRARRRHPPLRPHDHPPTPARAAAGRRRPAGRPRPPALDPGRRRPLDRVPTWPRPPRALGDRAAPGLPRDRPPGGRRLPRRPAASPTWSAASSRPRPATCRRAPS